MKIIRTGNEKKEFNKTFKRRTIVVVKDEIKDVLKRYAASEGMSMEYVVTIALTEFFKKEMFE